MAHDNHSGEKVVYVGDSRVPRRTKTLIPRDYSSYPGKSEAFVPNFLLKEWMVGAVFLVGFMALIVSHDPPLGYAADPTNTSFLPVPDWYFLFMFQLLKYPYMAEDLLVFGTLVVPGLMFGGLLLAPFLDTGKERKWYKRPISTSLMFLSSIAVTYLTIVSWDEYTTALEEQGIIPQHIERADLIERGIIEPGVAGGGEEAPPIVGEDEEGFQIYTVSTCIACHAADLSGVASMPALLGVGDRRSRDEIEQIMREGLGEMDPVWQANLDAGLTEDELETLVDWLAIQTADGAEDQ